MDNEEHIWDVTLTYVSQESITVQAATAQQAINEAKERVSRPWVSDIEVADIRAMPNDLCSAARLEESGSPNLDDIPF